VITESVATTLPTAADDNPPLPPRHPVWQKIRDLLVALSLANLCFLSASFRMLYSVDHGYFNKLPAALPALLALTTNILLLALAAFWVIRVRRRLRLWLPLLVIDTLFMLALLVPVDFCRRNVFETPDYRVVEFFKHPLTQVATLLLLAGFVWQHRRVARVSAVLVGLLSPLALFALGRIVLMSLGTVHLENTASDPVPAPLLPVRADQPRVVWIIFDEMDQRLSFDQRPPGLKLPELDRLRAGSLQVTNAYPPGDATVISMPALISGRRLSTVAVRNNSDLALTLADTGASTNWSELPSVFDSARALGVNAALVGWYHPYGRVLGRSLSYCSWFAFPPFEPARAATFGESMLRDITCLSGTIHLRHLYIKLCRASLNDSLGVVTNGTYGLALLHLAPPHKPAVYRPDKGEYSIVGGTKTQGYFNNLGLVDHFLGQLRAAMEASGQWNRTWFIVSADHSWRESLVYDGKRDYRVPFVVKPPGPATALTCSTQINTVLTHDLILAILRGELTNQQSALSWLEARPSTDLPVCEALDD
jgi:hypothetical protein